MKRGCEAFSIHPSRQPSSRAEGIMWLPILLLQQPPILPIPRWVSFVCERENKTTWPLRGELLDVFTDVWQDLFGNCQWASSEEECGLRWCWSPSTLDYYGQHRSLQLRNAGSSSLKVWRPHLVVARSCRTILFFLFFERSWAFFHQANNLKEGPKAEQHGHYRVSC
jgi:hypothetical protein